MKGIYATLLDSNGNPIKIIDGELRVLPSSFELDVARGIIPGMSTYNKFGRNIEIDADVLADIWDGGHTIASGGSVSLIWVAPTQARIHDIVSSSTSDAMGGVGARSIHLFGLPAWDKKEISEYINLDGTTNVPTVNKYVIIHRMKVETKGVTSINVGIIKATAQTDATVTAQIRAGQGQTQMTLFGVPSIQTAYLGRFYANCNKSAGAAGLVDVSLMVNTDPMGELTNFLTRHTFGLQTVGTSAFTIPYYVPKIIPGPVIIKIQVLSGTANMDVSAGFDLILVDN